MKAKFRRSHLALAAALALQISQGFAASVPGNLGYGLDKLVEDNLTLQKNPNAPKPYGGYTTEAAQSYASEAIIDPDSGNVLVDILLTGKVSADAMQSRIAAQVPSLAVQAADKSYRHTGIIEAFVAVDEVPKLAQISGVRSVFLALKPEHGSVTSGGPQPNVVPGDVLNKLGTSFDQGVTQHRVDRINKFYNPQALVDYQGSGISVGVISDSFNTRTVDANNPSAATDVAGFDLPGDPANPVNTTPVEVLRDLSAPGTDEGRGMAQIVYKMAPKSKIAFASGSFGEVTFANDVRAMAQLPGHSFPGSTFKADVITDDLSYGGEPFYGETIIGNAIDDVTAAGVSYFSSAGNNIGINAYESALRIVPDASAGGTLLTAAAGNTALAGTNINLATVPYNLYAGGFHNFNPNAGQLDVAQLVNMPGTTTANTEMQWDDPYDQKPLTPANPPLYTNNGTITNVITSVVFDDTSTPALPAFTAGTAYVISETALGGANGDLDGVINVRKASDNSLVATSSDFGVDETLVFTPTSSEQYRIEVIPCCGTTGDFRLDVDVPVFAATATGGASAVQFDGTTTPALPTFTAGTPYVIAESATSGNFDGIVTILDAANNVIVSQDTGTDEVVNFFAPASGQYKIRITQFGTTTGNFNLIVTQASGTGGVTTDLNLLAFTAAGNYIASRSLTSNNLANNRPVELGIVRAAGAFQMQFVIARANTPSAPQLPTRVRWSTRGNGAANIGPAEYFTYNATTTKGHASAKGCNGTAAYSVFRANVAEAFTSPGPATILFDKDANRLAVPEIRQVPRVAAADAGNTSSFPGPINAADSLSDPDVNPNFSGTSAAAPHAAAIAALVLQAHGGPGSVTPANMRTLLQTNVFPHDLDPSAATGTASTSDGGTVTITINSDNDSNVATGMNDPNSFKLSYSGPGSIASLTFNPQGTANTAGRPTSGTNGVQDGVPGVVSYFENDFPGMMFRPATVISAASPAIPARGFTLGTLTGLTAADITQPLNVSPFTGFSNPAPAPATATDFWTMTVGFPTGNFTSGKSMNFTVGRGAQRSSSLAAGGGTTLSALADLFGGGVMLPSGVTISDGMTFSGTTTAGGTFSGVIKNNIGYGWTPIDGFGFIDAAAATGAGTTILVAGGSANPNMTGVGFPTKLTVNVTPGASPTSTGLYVSANLESIGGAPAQKFYDDGTHGDVTAADDIFTFDATVAAGTAIGGKTFPVVVSDVQGRGGLTQIAFTVSTFTAPTGVGLSTPSSVAPTGVALLTVQTTPGTYPTSTGIGVTANLSGIGGLASQQFFDDGTNGDVTAGDGKFSFSATLPLSTTPGAKSLPATISDAQGRSSTANISLTVLTPTAPTGTGSASPSSVAGSGSTTLTVAVTGGTNPASTSLAVSADLTSIGGSANQAFLDDGVAPDTTAGDGIFTYGATVPLATTPGSKNLPVSITDGQSRTGSANIALTVLPEGALSGSGSASPSSVAPSASTLLTVSVSPGSDPTSTSIAVAADLTSIGGSATQAFLDDGLNGDDTAGDNIFSYNATVPLATAPGSKSLPVSISDGQSRTASANIALTVLTPTLPSGVGSATPSSVAQSGSTTLTVIVTAGSNPSSTGLAVTADLSSIGGSATQGFYDDGTHGDVTASDGTFTYSATVPLPTASGSKNLPVTISDDQSRTGSANIALTVLTQGTLSGSGTATPSSVAQSGTTLLVVQTTAAADPTSTGIAVTADLSSIGGSASQTFYDDGTHGDVTSADGKFSYSATVPLPTTAGSKNLTASISDDQGRTASANIALTVLAQGALSGSGIAAPSSVAVTGSTTLTVTVNAGTNPASTGITVSGNLTSIGGSAAQAFTDNNDGTFSFNANVPLATTPGTKSLPVTIGDTQGRSASANIALTVLTPTAPSGVGGALPNSGIVGSTTLLTVTVTNGTNPTSSGVTVSGDLTGIGGSATQAFHDDGLNGDATASDGVYSFVATVGNSATAGLKVLPVTISDSQNRTGNLSIAFNVTTQGSPSGSGLAVPASVGLGETATLLVSVTPGSNPTSTGLAVSVDLSGIGGSATQAFVDDGTNGDQVAGDNIFTYVAAIPANASLGSQLLSATITDGQSRSGSATIQINITTNGVIFQDGFEGP